MSVSLPFFEDEDEDEDEDEEEEGEEEEEEELLKKILIFSCTPHYSDCDYQCTTAKSRTLGCGNTNLKAPPCSNSLQKNRGTAKTTSFCVVRRRVTRCVNVCPHLDARTARTPEFELAIVLVSSPAALIVSPWGMTSDRALQLMRQSSPAVEASP
jgi:hypothetical protein